jgi:hypothetical protein
MAIEKVLQMTVSSEFIRVRNRNSNAAVLAATAAPSGSHLQYPLTMLLNLLNQTNRETKPNKTE